MIYACRECEAIALEINDAFREAWASKDQRFRDACASAWGDGGRIGAGGRSSSEIQARAKSLRTSSNTSAESKSFKGRSRGAKKTVFATMRNKDGAHESLRLLSDSLSLRNEVHWVCQAAVREDQ